MSPSAEYLSAPGLLVPPEALQLRRPRELVGLLLSGKLAYAQFVECRMSTGAGLRESVVFDVEVERPQVLRSDVRRTERVAAVFREADDVHPQALALRADFPEVLHLNQEEQERPRSLCLHDQSWEELRLTWTAPGFVARIREWMAKTAEGSLHEEGQPLEPVLLGSGYHIVIPHDLTTDAELPEGLDVFLAGGEQGRVFLALRTSTVGEPAQGVRHVGVMLRCAPHGHRVLGRLPLTLEDLAELTERVGLDLLAVLRSKVKEWGDSAEIRGSRLILVIAFPKMRHAGGPVEDTEIRAFLVPNSIEEIGFDIGAMGEMPGGKKSVLVVPDASKLGKDVFIIPLNPGRSFSWDLAATLNGLGGRDARRIAAVGAGALGSQVLMNLARAGFGTWSIIDHDFLLPHNLARHELPAAAVGHNKARALAITVNALVEGTEIAHWVNADVLATGEDGDKARGVIAEADLVLDMAASVAVSRRLSEIQEGGRRIAFFLSPSGRDLVLLAEDAGRKIRLDCLEMQYYRAVATHERLASHFRQAGVQIRYGQSCRDLSVTIPQDLVALHAGIAARALKTTLGSEDAVIRVWSADPTWASVDSMEIPVAAVLTHEYGDWTLRCDSAVLDKVKGLREEALPNETGGVLIGAHDMERRIVYIVDALLSPPDSVEWPTLYIRGCEDLARSVARLREASGQNLDYVGEWHSHPNGCAARPSPDDLKVLAWLAEEMAAEGKPPVMLIAGDDGIGHLYP